MSQPRPIATRAGGLPEVITDGEDGVLVDNAEMDQLGARVAALLADPDRLARLKRAARQTAIERFDSGRVVAQYEALYESVLAPA